MSCFFNRCNGIFSCSCITSWLVGQIGTALIAVMLPFGWPSSATSQTPPNESLKRLWTPDQKYEVVLSILPEVHELRKQLKVPEDKIREIESELSAVDKQLQGLQDGPVKESLIARIDPLNAEQEKSEAVAIRLREELRTLYESKAMEANESLKNSELAPGRHQLTPTHVERWSILATNLGKAGLVTPKPVKLAEFSEEYNGEWVLESRIVKGQTTDTTARMYFDIDPDTGSGHTLILEGGTAHEFVSPLGSDQAFSIGGLFETDVSGIRSEDIGLEGLAVAAQGEIVGSYSSEFRQGIQSNVTSNYQGFGTGSTMLGNAYSAAGSPTDEWVRIEVVGDSLIMVSSNLDLVDTYTRVSKRPDQLGIRVQGIWPLKEYWEILRKPSSSAERASGAAAAQLSPAERYEFEPHLFLIPPERK